MAISLSQCCDYSMKLYNVHAFNIYLVFSSCCKNCICNWNSEISLFYMARNFNSLQLQKSLVGYPYNLDFDYGVLAQLQHFFINSLRDPFIESNYGVHLRQFEVGVLDWFARLWELEKNEYWGYITSCGTEGNLHGILVGLVMINLSFRSFYFEIVETNCCPCKESKHVDSFCRREVFADGILYAPRESHYSVFKAARMYRMECIKVETLVSGEIDCEDFKSKLLCHRDKPAIINVNIGNALSLSLSLLLAVL